jgi:tRNA pseudouridine13 synthase
MEVHPIEKALGIESYLTQIPGIGGKLRTNFEDFIVEEITSQGELLKSLTLNQINPQNELQFDKLPINTSTVCLVVEKYNYETLTVVLKLAKFLQISSRTIGFAGLKDKRAITVQQISITGADPSLLVNFQSPGIYLNRIQAGKPIQLGNLNGNHFNIIVRQVNDSIDWLKEKVEQIKMQIQNSGIPNYYGPQRFGALRPNSHQIGRLLLLADYESALKSYLTDVFPQENKRIQEIRVNLMESWPHLDKETPYFPKELIYENKIVEILRKTDLNYKKTFTSVFPFRYILLFIHAFQSYLFNKLLSARIKAQMPLNQALEGDSVAILDKFSLPTHAIYTVSADNRVKLNEAIAANRAVVMLPIFGSDFEYSHHPLADQIARLIQEEKMDLSLFRGTSNQKYHVKATSRPIIFKPKEFTITVDESCTINFTFSLNRGSYATTLLREFMKTTPLNY